MPPVGKSTRRATITSPMGHVSRVATTFFPTFTPVAGVRLLSPRVPSKSPVSLGRPA